MATTTRIYLERYVFKYSNKYNHLAQPLVYQEPEACYILMKAKKLFQKQTQKLQIS